MLQRQIIIEISDILDNECSPCEKRLELNRLYGNNYSQIDGHCNQTCPVGKVLQAWGRQLDQARAAKLAKAE